MPSYRLLALPSSKNNPIPSSVQNLFLHTFGIAGRESLSLSWTTSRKISASLDSCSDVVTLRKLHARIFTHGFSGDILVGSRLLASYAKFEFLAESRLVFDGIHNANLILWNSLLVKYFKIGHHTEILRFYSNLRQRKIGLDGATITINLKSCIKLGTLEFGRGVHVDAFKFGLSMNKFVGSSLICLYSKYGDIEDAYKIFDEITEKDVVVYTSLVTGYSLVGDYRAYDAFGVVREMLKNQIDPNRVTLVSLLQVAAQLQILIEGRTVHGFAIRRRIGCSDEIFETSLLDMYIKCKATQIADCLFRKLNVRTIGSWNAMIASRLQTKQPLDALHLFILMIQEKVVPDLISLANVIFCFADLKYLRLGKSIHGYIVRSKVQLDLVATSALVDMYSQCNKLVHARKMFERIGTKDVISYNVMMTGYLQNECALEALEIFIEMVGASVRPNQSSILCALNALSDVKQIKQGRCIHGYVLRHGCHTSIEIFNKILNMYANCGHIDYARKVFNMIRYRDLVSWTSMMMGCISHGHADEAIALFQNMKREKLEYDSVALISLLQAVSQLGCLHLVKEVHCHLYRVKMEQEIHVINSLITTYSRSGELGMARNMFEILCRRIFFHSPLHKTSSSHFLPSNLITFFPNYPPRFPNFSKLPLLREGSPPLISCVHASSLPSPSMDSPPQGYRRNVGICLINSSKKIFAASRLDIPDAWQMPQGGIDEGEDPKVAAIRELKEETGVNSVEVLAEVPYWLTYDFPPEVREKLKHQWGSDWKGQAQKWFLLKFIGNEDEINLLGDGTEKPEFGEWLWMSPEEIIVHAVDFKKSVYKEVLAVFAPHLQ